MAHRSKPHILMVVGRGEAIRNFLYSDTVKVLSKNARVTLLSVVHDDKFVNRFKANIERVIPLSKSNENIWVLRLRDLIIHAHYRWQWSVKAQNKWEILDERYSKSLRKRIRHILWKGVVRLLAFRPVIELLCRLDRTLSWYLRPGDEFIELFQELKPDLIFNTSHVHGEAADLPLRIAHRMGIPTATFIYSWDNLTSRSRILVPYDYYFVWHGKMRNELLSIYPEIDPKRVLITGTPQLDYHFKPDFWLSRRELLTKLDADPECPFILYTTGMASDFPEEHHHIRLVIQLLQEMDLPVKPQLIVRTYIKGTSAETKAIADENIPGVIFPPILWDKQWYTPAYEDQSIYTSLLRHCLMGINAASTVSLELMMHDKPVINLGYDPPGSRLHHSMRWVRHIDFDHYAPVAASGGVMVAKSTADMATFMERGLTNPDGDSPARKQFLGEMFGDTLDGNSGNRVAYRLLEITEKGARTVS